MFDGLGSIRRMFRSCIVLAAATGLVTLGVVLLPAQVASANTQMVTNCADSGSGSLRQAVANAASGDTVEFALSCSTITLTSGDIEISTDLTIDGPGASTLAISGNSESQVFVIDPGVNVTISGLTIEDGFASNATPGGGGIENNYARTMNITDSIISDNSGEGINSGGNIDITNTIISENSGGGIIIAGGAIITDSTISDNSGGGIISAGDLTVTDSTISGNSATGLRGGGISNVGGDNTVLAVTGSTLSDNSTEFGGGIYTASGGVVTVTNSTLSGNSASVWGGGLLNLGGCGTCGPVTVTNSTLSGNTAESSGGGGINGEVTLAATIVANSGAGKDCVGGSVTDGGYNLDDDGSCGFSGTSLSDTPAGLDPSGLQNNGGLTQTIALEPGSPAIGHVTDASLCPATDQRDVPRPVPCDIGAYQSSFLTPMIIITPSANPAVSGPVTYTVAVNGTGPTPTGSVIISDGQGGTCSIQTLSSGSGSCSITEDASGNPYTVTASYSGDNKYIAQSTSITESVNTAIPTISTTPQPGAGAIGTTLNDQVTLSGLVNPITSGAGAGTVTMSLFSPSDPTCSSSPAYTQTITASNGNGTYTTSPGLAASDAGTWNWTASYSGDANNASASSDCNSETVTLTSVTPPPSPPSPPSPCNVFITRFTPTSGPVGTLLTITGTNLSSALAVDFYGAQAPITSATATQVTVAVPANATTGPITVVTFECNVTSTHSFKVTSPDIGSVSPMTSAVGAKVTIRGANLAKAQVSFNGVAAKMKSDTATRIIVTVPTGAKSGTITVTTKMGSATSTQSFTVTTTPSL
jgi:hypothetical protein